MTNILIQFNRAPGVLPPPDLFERTSFISLSLLRLTGGRAATVTPQGFNVEETSLGERIAGFMIATGFCLILLPYSLIGVLAIHIIGVIAVLCSSSHAELAQRFFFHEKALSLIRAGHIDQLPSLIKTEKEYRYVFSLVEKNSASLSLFLEAAAQHSNTRDLVDSFGNPLLLATLNDSHLTLLRARHIDCLYVLYHLLEMSEEFLPPRTEFKSVWQAKFKALLEDWYQKDALNSEIQPERFLYVLLEMLQPTEYPFFMTYRSMTPERQNSVNPCFKKLLNALVASMTAERLNPFLDQWIRNAPFFQIWEGFLTPLTRCFKPQLSLEFFS